MDAIARAATATKYVIAATVLIGATLVAGASARAAVITWDFQALTPLALQNHDIGASANFTSGGVTITAAGFGNSALSGGIRTITTSSPVDLYSKNLVGDEHGLGL